MTLAILWALGCSGDPPVPPPPPPAEAPEATIPQFSWRLSDKRPTSPAVVPADESSEAARAILDRVIRDNARDPRNPWAVKHALVALGTEFTLEDGRDPVDALFADWAVPVTLAGEELIEFPPKADLPGEDVRIEPHTDLLLKGLADAGVSPERIVKVKGKDYPIGALYRASLHRTWIDQDRLWTVSWNDTPWTLHGLAAWAPDDLAWTADGGHLMTLDAMTSAEVGKLHQETEFLRDALAKGEKIEKKKQGIFAYTCGGAHMIQGAAFAVARGFGTPADRLSVELEVPALYARYDVEIAQVDEALKQHPEYREILLDQRLKFTGHFLETAHRLAAWGIYTPDAAQTKILARARADLIATVNILEKTNIFQKLKDMKGTAKHQLYLDLVGDACHAMRGLDLDTGRSTAAY